MYYYESTTTDPCENLATEEYFFETLPAGTGLFMLWQNRDAVIVGKYQNTAEEINTAYVREHGIEVVRRMSGGGAVFHDLGGLNYTIITDEETSPCDPVWKRHMAPLLSVLRGYGLDARFTGRNDIEIGGRKIAGCAQYAHDSRTLHHGCILFDTDLTKVAAALRGKPQRTGEPAAHTPGEAIFVSRSDKSVPSRVTTIRACLEELGIRKTIETFMRDLRKAYQPQETAADEQEAFVPYQLTEADRKEIDILCESKYRTWAWNYGYRADYQVKKEQRFATGTV
ncbi:MAG: lipoate--protein ligase family protein, partial [Clostridiales bacterium]|nr:lipoate--protein ligase family protein [Clostridiales bacterium]